MPLDREFMSSHDMVVTCSDSGQPALSSTANLTVSVADDNDYSPRFASHSYSVTINENNNIGDVVIHVLAQDSDAGENARITYRIDPDASKHLSIDPVSGEVKIQTALDYEVIKRLDFEVVAEDGGTPSRTGRTTVRLTVLDEDDEKPKFLKDEFVFAVYENMPAGTAVGTVQAVDRDSPPFNSFYYSVDTHTIQSIVGVLSLDPVTGVLSTLKVLDREEKHVYNFNVQAGSSTDRQILRPDSFVSCSDGPHRRF